LGEEVFLAIALIAFTGFLATGLDFVVAFLTAFWFCGNFGFGFALASCFFWPSQLSPLYCF